VANSTTVNANGGLHIYKGATAYTTTVTSGANLGIGLGGYLHGARLENNATMTFYDGSYLGGWNDFAGTVKMQGKVNAAGSYISLELQNRTADQGYLISNIGYFQNVGRFSIEVSGKQTGNYILAYGATNFKDAVTLYIDDVDRGKIAVGQKLNYDGINYSLLKHGDTLSLNISNDSRLSCESITSGTANGLLA
jgi:autotransporter passenger strand-loop-strand repeat protein